MNALPLSVASYISLETSQEDEIYAPYVPYTDNVGSIRDNNDLYLNSDYKLNFISAMGPNMKVVHKRNIINEIRESKDLTGLIKHYNKELPGEGIYIVETYTLNIFNNTKLDQIISHLARYNTITPDMLKDIYKQYSEFQSSRRLSIPIKIRFLSLVPKNLLLEHGSLYIRQYDIVLTGNSYNAIPEHPNSDSKMNLSHIERVNGTTSNTVTVDITDNESVLKDTEGNNKRGRNYFMKLGNQVYCFTSTSDGVTPSEAVITIKRQNTEIPEVITVPKEQFEKYGLYEDKTLAIYNGDKKGILEDKKLQLELDKISNDKEKLKQEVVKLRDSRRTYKKELKLENDKLNKSLKEIAYQNDQLEMKLKLEQDKMKHEVLKMEHELNKMKIEKEMLRKKAVMEVLTNNFKILNIRLDMSKDEQKFILEQSRLTNKFKLDNSLLMSKHKLDSALTKAKFDREEKLTNLKFERDDELLRKKHARDDNKDIVDNVSKIINTGINLGKEFL